MLLYLYPVRGLAELDKCYEENPGSLLTSSESAMNKQKRQARFSGPPGPCPDPTDMRRNS